MTLIRVGVALAAAAAAGPLGAQSPTPLDDAAVKQILVDRIDRDHQGVGIVNLSGELRFVSGVAGHDVGDVAEHSMLGSEVIEDEIGDGDAILMHA